jgi:hypothetical protein
MRRMTLSTACGTPRGGITSRKVFHPAAAAPAAVSTLDALPGKGIFHIHQSPISSLSFPGPPGTQVADGLSTANPESIPSPLNYLRMKCAICRGSFSSTRPSLGKPHPRPPILSSSMSGIPSMGSSCATETQTGRPFFQFRPSTPWYSGPLFNIYPSEKN